MRRECGVKATHFYVVHIKALSSALFGFGFVFGFFPVRRRLKSLIL